MIISNFPGGGGSSKPEQKAFVDCTWAEVSAICKAGLASEYWALGDEKPMIAGAKAKILRIIGFDHDYVTDQDAYGKSTAGVTLEVVDAQSSLLDKMNDTNYSGTIWYSASSMFHCKFRQTLLPEFLSAEVPTDLKNVLVPVNKEYHDASGGSQVVSDTLFLLSVNEIFGGYVSGDCSEGNRYAYYTAGNSADRDVGYWTRSNQADSSKFYYINTSGGVDSTYVTYASGLYGFPAMCI